MIVDKDSGKAYDIRNEQYLHMLEQRQTKMLGEGNSTAHMSAEFGSSGPSKEIWGKWWKAKRRSN